MKKITKFFSALLALLAVGLITVSLVACSSGDDSKVEADSGKDNSDTKTELVAYKRNTTTSDGDPKTELITFYSDKTFALHETTADYDLDVCDGTYTGDPTKDGKVTATIKRMVSKSKMTKAFLEMGMSGVVTNKHAPLEACAEETMPCTISGNNLYDDEATPMTKVEADSGKDNSDTNKDKDSGKAEIDDRDLPSAVLKSKLPASVGTDPFNGTSWKYTNNWNEVMKVTFNNGVMEVSKSNTKDATYYYSYDATNKRLYYIFRTKWDDGKEYTSVEAYAKKDDKSLKYFGCPADYVEAHGKWQTIWFEQVNSISYEETESGITIEPYFNGNFTGLTGGEFSGSSQISGYDDGSHGISVEFEANRGSDRMDYSKKSIQGYVTAVNGNTLTCTAVVYNESVTGTFTVEVSATPAKGNDAKATMTIKAIDEDLKFICGQDVGAVSSEMKFSASLTDNEKKWTKVN